jgi:Nif-specific regulatory protein
VSLGSLFGTVVDCAGGYGILVRLLRDYGVNALWSDPYCENVLAKGFESRELRHRSSRLERLSGTGLREIVTASPAMNEALGLVDTVADRETTVLLLGETGTGKGMMARRIHGSSTRSGQPFVELNCAGLQPELTESELFGHERGAFTGAAERKLGLFEAAHRGTLFLDEIGEMDPAVQAKLLHVLEERRFRRLGGVAEIGVDVRVLVATHRNLEAMADEGSFRRDLYYRLNVFTVPIPPLRERPEDIVLLAKRFLAEFRGTAGDSAGLSDAVVRILQDYRWPGNVRELRNVMERAAILCSPDSKVQPSHLPQLPSNRFSPAGTLDTAERQAMEDALKANAGNIHSAAKELGISRSTLYRKMKKYDIGV